MMDAKTYLKQVELYDAHIDAKIEEVARLRSLITKVTTTWRDDVGTGSGNHDKIGETIAKIVDLQEEINKAIDAYVELKKDISKTMEQIGDPDQVAVLYKRYFQGEAWEQIACEMHMTFRNVCYIHGRALQAVESILKNKQGQ